VTRKFEIKSGEPLGEIKDICLNADGKKLCILSDQSPFPSIRIPDTKFYVYDIDMDRFMEQEVSPNRVPVEAYWDQNDARLFGVETEFIKDLSKGDSQELDAEITGVNLGKELEAEGDEEGRVGGLGGEKEEEFTGKTIETYFVTSDYGVKRQDVVKFEEGEETLLGVQVPYFYFMG